jgi:hypothetical protein
VLRGVMDARWLDEARAAIDANLDRVFLRGLGHDGDGTLATAAGALAGTGRPDLTGLFQLPAPHAAPFLRMLDHPAVVLGLGHIIALYYRSSTSCQNH